MKKTHAVTNVIDLELRPRGGSESGALVVAELVAVDADGVLRVRTLEGRQFSCDWLENAFTGTVKLNVGDRVLVMPPVSRQRACVLGRIAPYRVPESPPNTVIRGEQSLSLQCGAASLDLRADGKVMIRGEDVLVRARGTKRIKAGTVNIN